MKKTLLLLLLFCLGPIAQAELPAKEFWLSIELLVFKQNELQKQDVNEHFSGLVIDDLAQAVTPLSVNEAVSEWLTKYLKAYPELFFNNYIDLALPNQLAKVYKQHLFTQTIDINSRLMPFVLLPRKQLDLLDSEKALNRYNAVLYHEAWQQPVFDKHQEKPVSIIAELSDIHEHDSLMGTLTVSYSRFAHINLDLRLVEQQNEASPHSKTKTLEYFLDNALWQSAMPTMFQAPLKQAKTFRLNTDARVKLNKVQYIDHPVLGALVLVKKHPILSDEQMETTDEPG